MTQLGKYNQPRSEEKQLLERLRTLAATSANEYRPVLTAFIDPRSQLLAQSVAEQFGVSFATAGGFTAAEWRRGLFYPDYYVPEPADFELQVLMFKYPAQFVTLRHSDVLGAMMNLGVQRSVFGDFAHEEGAWELAATREMAPFLQTNLTQVARSKIQLVPAPRIFRLNDDWQARELLVAGLRLDALVAEAFKLPRSHAKQLFTSDGVRLNWRETQKVSAMVGDGDNVSVRGFGRIRVMSVLGVTAKDKWRLAVEIIDKRQKS
ncbi:YlmH family RNA-binding protein [Lacticaseibacillus songhuajiangensis]|jgi:RNA-binding protein YlmH|uniref:YlmH family RNA-binding protein n=1 Tax=Lacticaseibacillus songhuajiangensis TaxID=1296539 RepID=UPI000F7750E6|nr:YlmH/Sll1252 family protein [Lacticaseibacillus songhuajiangensis]